MTTKFLTRTAALMCVLALTVPVAAFAQRPLSLQNRMLSQQTSGSVEEPAPIGEPAPQTLLFTAPTSLDGPIDPETYIMGPSDELTLVIRGPQTTFQQLRVLPEGYVVLPNLGPYRATGVTLGRFRSEAIQALKKYYKNVEIDLLLAKPRSFVAYVSGEVERPGPVELTAPSRVSHAIVAAGRVTATGSVRLIELMEGGRTVQVVDLYKFLQTGNTVHNPVVTEGQIIHVPPRYMKASSVGELRKSGMFEIIPGETVQDLIDFSGGFATTADTLHLIVERTNPGGQVTNISVARDSTDKIALKDLDILVVPDLVSFHGMEPVEVLGGGGRDGSFQVAQSEELRDFIFRLWRFTPRFDVESAVIERFDAKGEPQYIYFNVRDVLDGAPVGDTILRPGDTISFPPKEKQVFVTGEVVLPGPVPFLPGYTAERYVALAGGPNASGTYNRIDIFGADGSIRSGGRDAVIYRGETIVVKQKVSKTLATFFWGVMSLTGLVLSIYAVSQ